MEYEFQIRNYRCFDLSNPLTISMTKGESVAFTGINNVGKSVPLKFFYEMRELILFLSNTAHWAYPLGNSNYIQNFNISGVSDPIEVFNNSNDQNIFINIQLIDHDVNNFELKKIEFELIRPRSNRVAQCKIKLESVGNYIHGKSYANVAFDEKKSYIAGTLANTSDRMHLFGVAQITKMFKVFGNSLYVGAFRNILNNTTREYYDLKIGTDFIKQWDDWQSGHIRAHQNKIIALVKEISDLLNLPNLSIHPTTDNQSLNVHYNENVYKLEELGAGIAQIIILLGNILVKEPAVVLIDEPELNLHPQLQVRFLALIEKYTDFLIYSTHSLGLARSFSEKVFGLSPSGTSIKQFNINKPKSSLEFSGELYYGALSQVGCNKILLCEGQTELKIFQHFLRCLGKGSDFLIIPLYGRNQINASSYDYLEELSKLEIPVFCIVDSEKAGAGAAIEKRITDFQVNCVELGIKLKILERRAIENYFTEKAIKKVHGTSYRALEPYEKLNDLRHLAWGKGENWKIASEMNFSDIETTDLGVFLKEISLNS